MKKLLLIALAAVGAVFAFRKLKSSKQEAALWAEATDNVE
ncbi:MAG: DLW-39 family protein [Nocardioidaceae bacterium]